MLAAAPKSKLTDASPALQDGTENAQLDSVVGSITSTEELFAVLNEQLNMVQDLADEVRHKGIALRQSEYARCRHLVCLLKTAFNACLVSKIYRAHVCKHGEGSFSSKLAKQVLASQSHLDGLSSDRRTECSRGV